MVSSSNFSDYKSELNTTVVNQIYTACMVACHLCELSEAILAGVAIQQYLDGVPWFHWHAVASAVVSVCIWVAANHAKRLTFDLIDHATDVKSRTVIANGPK